MRHIISALRKVWLRDPVRYACKVRSRIRRGVYQCSACLGEFKADEVQVDHIKPIGTFTNWDNYINKLFCSIDNLQTLCLDCHKAKTLRERH